MFSVHDLYSSEGVSQAQRLNFSAALFWQCFSQASLLGHRCKFTLQQPQHHRFLSQQLQEKGQVPTSPPFQGHSANEGKGLTRNKTFVWLLSVLYLL